jgi:hypothetical protein
MRRRESALAHIVILAWLSCGFAVAFPLIRSLFDWRPEAAGPELPYLLLPRGTPTDVMSSVSHLTWILIAAALCCVPLEAAKLLSRRIEHGVFAFIALLTLQVVLVGEFVKTYAYDWWRYLLSLAGVRPITPTTWMITNEGLRPWWTLAATLLVTLMLLGLHRGNLRTPPLTD